MYIYVLIYSAAQLQECLINLLTYLLNSRRTSLRQRYTDDSVLQ